MLLALVSLVDRPHMRILSHIHAHPPQQSTTSPTEGNHSYVHVHLLCVLLSFADTLTLRFYIVAIACGTSH